MRLYGLLCFYDEPPDQLVACVRGLERAGVDHLIAVDGAYALYPEGANTSHPNQHAALDLACLHYDIGLTLHVPEKVWEGNEVQKRSFMFALAWACARENDWFFVMDADQEVKDVPSDFKQRLMNTPTEVAETNFLDTVALRANQKDWPPNFTVRNLFKAQPIRLVTNHITYVTEDGRLLWGGPTTYTAAPGISDVLEPALDLTDLLVIHRPDKRPDERQRRKLQYYNDRDEERIERGRCRKCDAPSARIVAINWRMARFDGKGDKMPIADWLEVCEDCGKQYDKVGRRQLRKMNVDPDKVRIENRNGLAPDRPGNREIKEIKT